ncbi:MULTISPECIES: hypothetical protein [Sphingomonadaceae]|uniref:hypothetical protein n=1 Tax=Sphingomonadales TaxID=204457 RepID=UPI001D729184|nr:MULTISPECIES: hypothetical protein [Sphingomonadaceae]MBX9663017.1 hypothetical protein [Novosphingobium sp.]MBY0621137.1 hypothetical protein [Sphingomonas ursincola]
MGLVSVFSGVQRRRYWSDEQKHALVSANSASGVNVAEISRLADGHMAPIKGRPNRAQASWDSVFWNRTCLQKNFDGTTDGPVRIDQFFIIFIQ